MSPDRALAGRCVRAAALDGTIGVSLLGGFHPALGDTFPIMTFASETGDFSTKTSASCVVSEYPSRITPDFPINR